MVLLKGMHLTWSDFAFVLVVLLATAVGSWMIRLLRQGTMKGKEIVLVFGWIVLVTVFLTGAFLRLGKHLTTSFREFDSPDKKYRLVVCKSASRWKNEIRLYERENLFLVRELDVASDENEEYPFRGIGSYEIAWDGAEVTLSIQCDAEGKRSDIKLDLERGGRLMKRHTYYPGGMPSFLQEEQGQPNEDYEGYGEENGETENSSGEASQEEEKIREGLYAVAKAIRGGEEAEGEEITYSSKGTPQIKVWENVYLYYDRQSLNTKCTLYVLQRVDKQDDDSLPQIIDMYAYEYETGRVIRGNRHDWADAGTEEYREAIGE